MENKTTKNTKNAKVVKTASTAKKVVKKVEKVAKKKNVAPKAKEVAKKGVKAKVAVKTIAKDTLISTCYGVFSDKGKLRTVHKSAGNAKVAKKYLSDSVKKLALNTKKSDGQVYCLAAKMKKGNTKQVGCAALKKDLVRDFNFAKLNPEDYVKGDVQKFEISKINYKIM